MNDWKKELLQIKKSLPSANEFESSNSKAAMDALNPLKTDHCVGTTKVKRVFINTPSKPKHSKKVSLSEASAKPAPNTPTVTKSSKKYGSRQPNSISKPKIKRHVPANSTPSVKLHSHTIVQRQPAQKQIIESSKLPPVPEIFTCNQVGKLTRKAHFKLPEPWVVEGIKTQKSLSPAGRVVDIVIGLDFGTSFTKAAVGFMDIIYPVSWHGTSASPNEYLLPSEYSVLPDGSCQVGQASEVTFDQVRKQLKHPFIAPFVSSDAIADASVFISLVLRYVRAWIYLYHGEKIGERKIRWLVNIGAPSNGLETYRLTNSYHQLGRVAWDLSVNEPVVSREAALKRIKSLNQVGLPHDLFDLQIIPEFVAQIAGYVQSAKRKSGLHALVDIGGGTLDIVTFIVHQSDDEDVFPFLIPEVKPLGTQMLYQNRLVGANTFNDETIPDELAPVIDCFEFAKVCGLDPGHVASRDNLFWRVVKVVIGSVIHRTKRTRYRLSDAWSKGLPIFLTGGGSNIGGYVESVKSRALDFVDKSYLMPLPRHPRLTDTFKDDSTLYQRLSVACGLAMDSFSLGRIIPARDVTDDIRQGPASSKLLDRDELYPK